MLKQPMLEKSTPMKTLIINMKIALLAIYKETLDRRFIGKNY